MNPMQAFAPLGRIVTLAAWMGVALTLALPGAAGAQTLEERVRAAHAGSAAPALGAVTVSCQGPARVAVAGTTRLDGGEAVARGGRFNIGSNAKSMLASLAATYVAEGRLTWESTVGEVFAAERAGMDSALAGATLAQLLSHRSGLAAYDDAAALDTVALAGTPSEQRLAFALRVLAGSPEYAPGTKFVYSNAGYVVAGALLERIGGAPFEALMRERLFRPLRMDAAFGTAARPGRGQPWGHFSRQGVHRPYVDAAPPIPAFLQPAGDVSLALADYGRYLREHLCGLTGGPTHVLTPDAVRTMHEPRGDDGAGLGWGRYELGGTPASVHVGGTGTFTAYVAVVPGRDLAAATVVNSGFGDAGAVALALLLALVEAAPPAASP